MPTASESILNLSETKFKPIQCWNSFDDTWVLGTLVSFPALGAVGSGFFCPNGEPNSIAAIWVDVFQLKAVNNVELYLYY